MKVECDQCKAKLSLPEEKLEPGSEFSFVCPKCKNKNTVRIPSKDKTSSPGATLVPFEDEDDEQGMMSEFFEEGAKPAMICFDEGPLQKKLEEIVAELGYVPILPGNARDALNRLRVTQYNLVLLDEGFNRQTLENNAILRLLQHMDMTTRRRMYVALFGKNLRTLDHMSAFALSVNAVIDLADEELFPKVLYRGLSEYERFYKVFFDVLREMGKS